MKFEGIGLPMQLKSIAAIRGITMDKAREEYNRKFNKDYVQQSFSRKIRSGAFRYDELQQLGEILGFKVKLELIDKEG